MNRELASTSLAAIARSLADPKAWAWRGPIRDWLADGFVMMFAPSGSGKTFIATDWAIRVAAGLQVGPHVVNQGAVIYVAAEDLAGVQQRLVAAAEAIGAGFDLPVHVLLAPCPVDDRNFPGMLIRAIGAVARGGRVSMIVIDTLRAACADSLSEERVASVVTANLFALAEGLGNPAVMAIHHTGKDEGRGAGGSKILFDRANTVLRVSRTKIGASVVVEKQRNGPDKGLLDIEFATHRVSFAPAGHGKTLVVASVGWPNSAPEKVGRQAEDEKPAPRLSPSQRTLWETIQTVRKTNSNAGYAEVRDAYFLVLKSKTLNSKKSLLSSGLNDLVKKGLVPPDDPIVSVRRAGNSNGSNASNGDAVSVSVRAPLYKSGLNALTRPKPKRVSRRATSQAAAR